MGARTPGSALALILWAAVASAQTVSDPSLTVETVASGLSLPTAMAFLGPNDFLVLQKNNGQVRRVLNGQLLAAPVLDVAVDAASERGLLGIAVTAESPQRVFLYFTESSTGADTNGVNPAGNRIYRYTWNGAQLVSPVLVRNLPVSPGPNHDGGTLLLGPGLGLAGDGRPLYAVIGDLNRDGQLENYASGLPDDTGVILRIQQDGSVDPTNPALAPYCSNSPQTTCTSDVDCGAGTCQTAVRNYFAYGVRNSFGLTVDPLTGNIWDTENGPNVSDEVNLVAPGFNSGWEDYMGPVASEVPEPAGLFHIPGSSYSNPEFTWSDTLAPTAILFPIGSALGAAYDGVALVGDSNTGSISRFPLNGSRNGFVLAPPLADLVANTAAESALIRWGSNFGGVTDLKIGPDGLLYVVSIGSGIVYRIRPVATSTPTRTPTRTPTPSTPIPTSTATATPTRTPIPPTCNGLPATIVGTDGPDVINGTNGADVIVGLGGDDEIFGAVGNDTICGNDGNDKLKGGTGADFCDGGSGTNTFIACESVAPTPPPLPTATPTPVPPGITCNGLAATIVGTEGADVINGTNGADVIVGLGGDVEIFGAVGNDTICGNDGNDKLKGGTGADFCDGGSGTNTFIACESFAVTPTPGPAATPTPGPGTPLCNGLVATIIGTSGDDKIDGTEGADVIVGLGGNDNLRGLGGNDTICGNEGNDLLRGSSGTDFCDGGLGTNTFDSCETTGGG